MPAPAVTVTSGSSAPTTSPPTDTGTWFVTGLFERGPTDRAVLCTSYAAVLATFGAREASTYMHDALQTFFEEGGSRAYITRAPGPTPVLATVTAKNGSSENTLQIDAASYGAWANDIDVVIVGASTTRTYTVKEDGVVVEEAGPFTTNAEAVAAFANSSYIRLKDLGKGLPSAATKELASGTDDRGSITETQWAAAEALHTPDLGPGQQSRPGVTSAEAQKALLAFAKANNRVALLDGTDTATVATLTSQATTLREHSAAHFGGLFAPWPVIPGLTGGTTRTVPPCALQAGLTARSDAVFGNPNLAIAGIGDNRGVARYASSLSQAAWSAADRGTLADAGVNVIRVINDAVVTYDDITLVNGVVDDTYLLLSNNRCIMAIKAGNFQVGLRHLFAQLDPLEFAEFGNDLNAEVLLPLYEMGALYGDTPEDAYTVVTNDTVNTDKTRAERKLRAVEFVDISESCRNVEIEINVEAS